jgi:hypothetical protein
MTTARPFSLLRMSLRVQVAAVVCAAMAVAAAIAALAQSGTAGQPAQAPEVAPAGYDVKAAYLLNFGRFLRLDGVPSASRRTTFDICVLGHDFMGHLLDDIAANQTIDDRAVRVLRVGDAYGAKDCDIVFLSLDEGDGIPLDLDAIGKSDVLTVSDAPDFLKYGGMIQFVNEDNRVRFEVNLDAVNRTHIVLSSELLRVASSVTGGPQPEAQR